VVALAEVSAQNRRQKVFNMRLCVCAGGFDTESLSKILVIYSVSYFNLGAWCFVCGANTKAPVATGLYQLLLMFRGSGNLSYHDCITLMSSIKVNLENSNCLGGGCPGGGSNTVRV